jgi:hypothetical protein
MFSVMRFTTCHWPTDTVPLTSADVKCQYSSLRMISLSDRRLAADVPRLIPLRFLAAP